MGDGRPRREKAKELFHKDLLLPTISAPWNQAPSHRRRSFSPRPDLQLGALEISERPGFHARGGDGKSALIEPAVRLGKEPWDEFTRRRRSLVEEGNILTDWMQGGPDETESLLTLNPSVELITGANSLSRIPSSQESATSPFSGASSPDSARSPGTRSASSRFRMTVKKVRALVALTGDKTGAALEARRLLDLSAAGSAGSPEDIERLVPMQAKPYHPAIPPP